MYFRYWGLLKVNETGMCGKHNGIGACARCAMNSFDTSGRVERDHSMRRELFADVMSGVHVNRSTQPCYLDTQTHIRHTHRAAAVLAHPLWGPVGARGRLLPEGKAENVCRSYVQIYSFGHKTITQSLNFHPRGSITFTKNFTLGEGAVGAYYLEGACPLALP